MDLLIRQYKKADLSELMEVWEKSAKLAHSFLTVEFFDQERRDIPNIYIPSADTWVAEINGSVIGFISLVDNEVGGLFVDPDFHGRKVGYSLVNKAHSIYNVLEVEVFKDNSIGLNFYLRYGFIQLSEYIHSETGRTMLRLGLKQSSSLQNIK